MDNTAALSVEDMENAFEKLARGLPNGCWQSSVLNADESGNSWQEGEAMLDQIGFSRNLIPASFGGGWGQMDRLMDLYRTLYRRDPCLGLGYAGSSFIACCNIWSAGSHEQQQKVSRLLKSNKKLACSYYETDHGNDLAAVEFSATPEGEELVLSGVKKATTNIQRADAAVVFARTSDNPGSRSHSQLLLFKDQLPQGAFQDLERHASVGMRGIQLGGFKLEGVRQAKSVILGELGQALETTMRSFQVTRCLIPGMFLGVLDSAIRLAMQFSRERQLHGKALIDFSKTRYELSMAYLDALLIDSVCRLGARSLQILPSLGCLYAPAIKVVVPHLLLGSIDRLASLLGASFYQREGNFGLFQKLLRDSKPVGFAHVGRPACQLTLLPLLHLMARKTCPAEPLPSLLTNLDSEPEPIDFSQLSLSPRTTDPVLALLDGPSPTLDEGLLTKLRTAKTSLMDALRKLHPTEMTAAAPKHLYELSTTYASLLTASSCLAWHNEGRGPIEKNITNLLVKRQLIHMHQLPRDAWSEHEINTIFEQLHHRYENNISFDLVQHPLTGWSAL